LLVWANFGLPRQDIELSTSALPSYLLEKMGIPPTGFLAVSDTVERRVSVVRGYAKAANGTASSWESLPADQRVLLEDYRLLEYDLLLGNQYALQDTVSQAEPCKGHMKAPSAASR
jgi:hypothetical protein